MGLLDAESLPPPSPWPMRLVAAALLLAAVGSVLWWQFRYYEEKKTVERFMEALKAGDYPQAYEIWQPTPAYAYSDFLEDWGDTTSFGRVRSYQFLGIESSTPDLLVLPGQGRPGRTVEVSGEATGVIVRVLINDAEEVRIWVEKDDQSLSFPPF
ncbi:MAG: hypothetical protein V3U28_10665 [Candidatus Acidoferrales bacterium]